MSEIKRNIHILIEDMDTLRMLVLTGEQENAEVRSLLRRMFHHLEEIERQPSISTALHAKIIALLTSFMDAEHAAIIKGAGGNALPEEESEKIEQYVADKRNMLLASQHDLPAVYELIIRCSDLLGKEPAIDTDLTVKCHKLESQLREHLQDDARLRGELNQITSAFENSLSSMTDILQQVGGEAPELIQVQEMLKQDIPNDPKEARKLMQSVRESLLQAGEKLSSATESLKHNMQNQMSQMQSLSTRLEDAESQARSDPLTGLGNRRKLTEFLSTLSPENNSFIMLDIDHFKSINDQHGHDAGDEILTGLSTLLTESVRGTDMVARLGGEEFCIVLPEMNASQAFHVAEKIRKAVESYAFKTTQGKVAVTISLGVAEQRRDEDQSIWIKRSDKALYQSKKEGRNRVTMMQ